MSGVTPKYGLVYYVLGDKYRASDDLVNMTTVDNQLSNLSTIVGDGVLDGWVVTAPPTGLIVNVSIGTGFIGSVVHNTVSIKHATVFNDSTTLVYMKSTMLGMPGGFSLSIESSFSNAASATFVDTTPPATPSGFSATATEFDTVLLNWSPNVEADFDHYVLYRSTNNILFVSLGSLFPPAVSYADTGRSGSQIYYYRLTAVDTSGNASTPATANATTPADATLPADVTGLTLYPGNTEMCLVFNPSASSDVIAYLLTVQKLNIDGSVNSTLLNMVSIGLSETHQLTGLVNTSRYSVRIQAKNVPLNVSPGVVAEATPLAGTSPFDVTGLSSTPLSGSISLSWTASASATGSAVGQKSSYMVRVMSNGASSLPMNVGLVVTTTINSYLLAGATQFFSEGVEYLFRVTTIDSFGNESAGAFVKGEVLTSSVPNSPRNLAAASGDESAVVTWSHSSSPSVAGYNITYNAGLGFIPEIVLGYVETFTFAPPTYVLPNGTPVTVRIRTRDTAGNFSNPSTVVVTPEIDTTPPRVPLFVRVNPQDGFVNVTWQANPEPDLAYYVVYRQEVTNPLDSPPNAALNVVPGSSMSFNVGLNTSLVDVGLVNGKVYAYSVSATILRDIISDPPGIAYSSLPSSTTLTSPSPGINVDDPSVPQVAVPAPTNLTAVFGVVLGVNTITLNWTHSGIGGVTGFNIYRSTSQYSNFVLTASVAPGVFAYSDTGLVNAVKYTYMVTAARDNATPLVESSGIQPANTVLLASVTAVGGNVTVITDSQRLVDSLGATITEQTMALLLAHHHSVMPLNGVPTTAVPTLSMIDVGLIQAADIAAASLSPASLSYYTNLTTDPVTGASISYTPSTTYVIDPASVTYNVPFIGDFQILVNGAAPTVEFSLDAFGNTLSFAAPLAATDDVTLDGQQITFYVPAAIDLGYQGFDITVDGGHSVTPFVDEATQTLTFLAAISASSVVVVTVEPLVPDFGTQVGARQVSLSPNIVLSDFASTNSTTYTSTSGAFSSTDTVFVLVNGLRSNLDYFVDFVNKAIVFSDALDPTFVVSLEILGHEEVDPATSLPTSMFGNLDASQFTTGKFIKPQLPPISHDGRVKEPALPIFTALSTSDRYVYAVPTGLAGSGRTPYAMTLLNDGSLLVGSSAGVLRTYGAAGILVSQQDNISISNSSLGSGVTFSSPSEIVSAAQSSSSASGRVAGNVVLSNVSVWPPHVPLYGALIPSLTIQTPTMATMIDGRILITGGTLLTSLTPPATMSSPSSLVFIFDPALNTTREVSPMGTHRQFHSLTTLPNGLVLAAGGQDLTSITCVSGPFSNTSAYPSGLAYLRFLSSCELFNPSLETWSATGSMSQARYNHSANVIDPSNSNSDVLVAGGAWESSVGQWAFTPDPVPNGVWCNDPSQYWTFAELASAERYDQSGSTWSFTAPMTLQMAPTSSKVDSGNVVVDGAQAREVYDPLAATWSQASPVSAAASLFQGTQVIDGPIKQFFTDASGNIYAVTRNNVFSSSDGGLNFVATTGLDAVGVVHAVSQSSDGTMFAATDLGVYEISPDILSDLRWFQGGFIGAGTTETFDLQPIASSMLAATEIGLFTSSDGGASWSQVGASYGFQDVTNVELIGASALFLQSGQTMWRSADGGTTWSEAGTYAFANQTAKLVARSPLDLFFATDTGLYASQDGTNFVLVDFDANRRPAKNNVQMATVVGSDLLVGYDNIIFSVGPDYGVIVVAEFTGIVPTVRVNGQESRGGFRYDTVNSLVVFEEKRFAADDVDITSNYSLYALVGDGWYSQRPNAAVQVFVNGTPQADGTYTTNARLGEVSFVQPLSKTDAVTLSIANTSIADAGEFFHDELEDNLEEQKGLPLALGMDYEASVLQFGLAMDHNFVLRHQGRNSACLPDGGPSAQPFTSMIPNAQFIIMGRNDFDRFNSTIDYAIQSAQKDIGTAALIGMCLLDVSPTQFWVGSDQGVFILDPSSSFVVSQNIEVGASGNPVRDLYTFGTDVYAVAADGIWDVTTSTKNPGNGLPTDVFVVSSINNVLVAGTSDAVYYSDSLSDVPYSTWFRASFTATTTTTAVVVAGSCSSLLAQNGTAYAAVGGSLFSSADGKAWRIVYSFTDTTIQITSMAFFADSLVLGTNKGVWNDDGTARSNTVSFRMEMLENTILASTLYINDVFGTAITDTAPGVLYAVGNFPYVYELSSSVWSKSPISAPSASRVAVNAGGSVVVVAGNTVIIG